MFQSETMYSTVAAVAFALSVVLSFVVYGEAENTAKIQIFYGSRTWFGAEQSCIHKGGHLATIRNVADNKIVHQYLKRRSGNVWIGLNDIRREGKWVWTGDDSNFRNWKWGEPNNAYNSEDCVQYSIKSGKWNDVPCNRMTRNYACSIRPAPTNAPVTTTAAPPTTPTQVKWYCAVTMNKGIQKKTKDLQTAQRSLGKGNGQNRQAIIPMSGNTAEDPHTLTKSWDGGSMFWWNWPDIRNMQRKCVEAGPPTTGL